MSRKKFRFFQLPPLTLTFNLTDRNGKSSAVFLLDLLTADLSKSKCQPNFYQLHIATETLVVLYRRLLPPGCSSNDFSGSFFIGHFMQAIQPQFLQQPQISLPLSADIISNNSTSANLLKKVLSIASVLSVFQLQYEQRKSNFSLRHLLLPRFCL